MSYSSIIGSGYGQRGRRRRSGDSFPTSPQPKSVLRPKQWSDDVEEAYRFQVAGYRDEREYKHIKKELEIDRWPDNGYVKKLQRKDGTFYYYSKHRECKERDVNRTKLYSY